jgi:hypothetical protein
MRPSFEGKQMGNNVVPSVLPRAVMLTCHYTPSTEITRVLRSLAVSCGETDIFRVNMRHGVSRLRSGHRHTLGIIFHDAK